MSSIYRMLPMIFCGLAILATSINALFSPSSNTGLLNVSQRHPPGCEGAYYGWANPARVAACHEAFGLLSRFSDVDGPQKFGSKGIGGENTILPWRLSSCELPIAISHIAILSIFTLFMGKKHQRCFGTMVFYGDGTDQQSS